MGPWELLSLFLNDQSPSRSLFVWVQMFMGDKAFSMIYFGIAYFHAFLDHLQEGFNGNWTSRSGGND